MPIFCCKDYFAHLFCLTVDFPLAATSYFISKGFYTNQSVKCSPAQDRGVITTAVLLWITSLWLWQAKLWFTEQRKFKDVSICSSLIESSEESEWLHQTWMLIDQLWTGVGCWRHNAQWQTRLHLSIIEIDKLEATEKSVSTFACGLATKVPESEAVLEGEVDRCCSPSRTPPGTHGSHPRVHGSHPGSASWDVQVRLKVVAPIYHTSDVTFGSGKPLRWRTAPLCESSAGVLAPAASPTPRAEAALHFVLASWASRPRAMQLAASCEMWRKLSKSHRNMNLKQRLRQTPFSNADFIYLSRKSLLSLRSNPISFAPCCLPRTGDTRCPGPPAPSPSPRSMLPTHWGKLIWSCHLCQQGLLTWLDNDCHTASRSKLLSTCSSDALKACLYPWKGNDAHFLTGVLDIYCNSLSRC